MGWNHTYFEFALNTRTQSNKRNVQQFTKCTPFKSPMFWQLSSHDCPGPCQITIRICKFYVPLGWFPTTTVCGNNNFANLIAIWGKETQTHQTIHDTNVSTHLRNLSICWASDPTICFEQFHYKFAHLIPWAILCPRQIKEMLISIHANAHEYETLHVQSWLAEMKTGWRPTIWDPNNGLFWDLAWLELHVFRMHVDHRERNGTHETRQNMHETHPICHIYVSAIVFARLPQTALNYPPWFHATIVCGIANFAKSIVTWGKTTPNNWTIPWHKRFHPFSFVWIPLVSNTYAPNLHILFCRINWCTRRAMDELFCTNANDDEPLPFQFVWRKKNTGGRPTSFDPNNGLFWNLAWLKPHVFRIYVENRERNRTNETRNKSRNTFHLPRLCFGHCCCTAAPDRVKIN